MSRKHFQQGTSNVMACGRTIRSAADRTHNTAEVTCQRCQSTAAYTRRSAIEANAAVHQRTVDLVAGIANDVATERDYCSTYDEIVSEINEHLAPHGLRWPDRKSEWEIEVHDSVEAADEEEALRRIAEDPASFIALRRR